MASTGRDRAVEELVSQQSELAALGQRALAGDELVAVMEDSVELVARRLDVAHVSLMELSPAGDTMRLRAGVGWRAGVVGATVSLDGGGYADFALHATEPVLVLDLAVEKRFSPSSLLLDHGVVSSVAVPIRGHSDSPYGVLGAHATGRRLFAPADVGFVRGIANLMAVVIQRRRQALELNDTVLQGLVVARYALEADDPEQARRALDGVLERAQAIIDDMLGGDDSGRRGLLPGDLRRERPADVEGGR